MNILQELQLKTTDDRKMQKYKRWFRVSLYIIFLLAGQSAALLLERLYYDKGGNSNWMIAFVQSSGFPLLIPLICNFKTNPEVANNNNNNNNKNMLDSLTNNPKISILFSIYLSIGLLLAGSNLMYSYGLQYLPLSTYSLICSTELAFNALFAYFLNSQKFTALIFNSIFLLTISTSLLAFDPNSDDSIDPNLPKEKYIFGFIFTLGASATFSLYLSVVQLSFEKVMKRKTFSAVLDMQFYPSLIATCACVVGLFASGEWKSLNNEMEEYQEGKVPYIMTLFWTAVSWQICYIGMLGLVYEVSSLFSNVMGSLVLPIVSSLSVMFFHDKINGVEFIALMLAIWGFFSYVYQHYLDDKKSKAEKTHHRLGVSRVEVEI